MTSGCKNNDCEQNYFLYIPTVACHNNDTNDEFGILSLVFAVHCLGCNPSTLMYWTKIAEQYKFVLVIPEGLQNSFNGQNCCGSAQAQNIDDIGFFQTIVQELTPEFPLKVSPDLVYGLGWSNGAYMVNYAAHLFQVIAPISGYQVDLPTDAPTAIFLHHSQDDSLVRITGCCTNTSMPKCCCGLSSYLDTCTSMEQKMTEWAHINQCSFNGDMSTTKIIPYVTWNNAAVTCYSFFDCMANTTYCIHTNHQGHFNRPSLEQSFPMSIDSDDFFARHACEIHSGGQWKSEETLCLCPSNDDVNHYYCSSNGNDEIISLAPHQQQQQQQIAIESYGATHSPKSITEVTMTEATPLVDGSKMAVSSWIGIVLIVALLLLALLNRYSDGTRDRQIKRKGFEKVSTIELQTF